MVYNSFTRSLQGFLRDFSNTRAPQGTSPGSIFPSRQSSYVTPVFPIRDIEFFYQSPFIHVFSENSSIKVLLPLSLWFLHHCSLWFLHYCHSVTSALTPLSFTHFGFYVVFIQSFWFLHCLSIHLYGFLYRLSFQFTVLLPLLLLLVLIPLSLLSGFYNNDNLFSIGSYIEDD